MRAREIFPDLARHFVEHLLAAQVGNLRPCPGGADAAPVEQPARADAPAERELVILRLAESARSAFPAAAQSAREYLRGEAGNERAKLRALAGLRFDVLDARV